MNKKFNFQTEGVTGQPTVAGNKTLSSSTHRNIYWKSARTGEN